jgi:HAD superfamily hydrolase (TIGR01549 family)
MTHRPTVVFFDFYGTLAYEDPSHPSISQFFQDRLITLPSELHMTFWTEDVVGEDHTLYSVSRDKYKGWARDRRRTILHNAGVPPESIESTLDAFEEWDASLQMRAYPETHAVLKELGRRGIRRFIASNWDWDIDRAIRDCGITDLIDGVVGSGRLGYRKPHLRFYELALKAAGTEPSRALFVGDNWIDDVEGPMWAGIAVAVHLNRSNDPIRHQFYRGPSVTSVPRITDLRDLVQFID